MANPNPEPHPENLRPWKKGESGNRQGSSKAQRRNAYLLGLIYEFLDGNHDLVDPKTKKKIDLGHEMVKVAFHEAIVKKDFKFWREIMERIHGRVPFEHAVTGKDGGPLEVAEAPTVTVEELAALAKKNGKGGKAALVRAMEKLLESKYDGRIPERLDPEG